MKITKAVIPIAGLGTRFYPITKSLPKSMLTVIDVPTIQLVVEEAVNSGIEEIIFITDSKENYIKEYFSKDSNLVKNLEEKNKHHLVELIEKIENMAEFRYVNQQKPLGLGHAVLCAKEAVGKDMFAVLLGDDIVYSKDEPAIRQLINIAEEKEASVLGLQEVPPSEISKYGSLDGVSMGDGLWLAKDMIEKPTPEEAPSLVAILGRYVISSNIFEVLENTPKGVGGEIQLTDGLCLLAKQETMYGYEFRGRRYDMGNKALFLEAVVEYALRNKELGAGFKQYLIDLVKTF